MFEIIKNFSSAIVAYAAFIIIIIIITYNESSVIFLGCKPVTVLCGLLPVPDAHEHRSGISN